MLSAFEDDSSACSPVIIRDRSARALDHTECRKARICGTWALATHKLGVSGIRPGIAALDIVDAEIIQHGRDATLVIERKVDARRLRPIAQRRVEQIQPFLWSRSWCSLCRFGRYLSDACRRAGQLRALASGVTRRVGALRWAAGYARSNPPYRLIQGRRGRRVSLSL